MQDRRAVVVLPLLVPTKHELVSIRAIQHSSLIHDSEVLAVLEDLSTAFLRMYADDSMIARTTISVIFLQDTVSFEDSFHSCRRVEW